MRANESIIQSLHKLKELMDGGALSREEYELLKEKLISPLLENEAAPALTPDTALATIPAPEASDAFASHTHLKLGTGPEKTVDPAISDFPPKLEVDHLLASAEYKPDMREESYAPEPYAYAQSARTPKSGGYKENSPSIQFEPDKLENFADFSPLRGREPRNGFFGRGRMLDLVLVVSIFSLVGFGTFIYFEQKEWESEQIVSRQTQAAGGLAPQAETADLTAPADAPPEAPADEERRPAAAPLPADPTPSGGPDRQKADLPPVAPAEAPASDTASPAATPADPEIEPSEDGGSDESPDNIETTDGEEPEPEILPLAPKPPAPLIEDSLPEERG